ISREPIIRLIPYAMDIGQHDTPSWVNAQLVYDVNGCLVARLACPSTSSGFRQQGACSFLFFVYHSQSAIRDSLLLTGLTRSPPCGRFGGLQALLRSPLFLVVLAALPPIPPEKGDLGEAGCPLGASPNPTTA